MMINKRLINTVSQSKKYIYQNVAVQLAALLANLAIMWSFVEIALSREAKIAYIALIILCIAVRSGCSLASAKLSYLASKSVKKTLRKLIYEKLLKIGPSYNRKIQTSEIVQLSVEGVDQLDTYFGGYLPQFIYAMLAPVILFAILLPFNSLAAIVLFVCVPLIPLSIAAVQTFAKKLLSKYWGKYAGLGDTFLENLQGLTTLKIYRNDDFRHRKMNEEAENFRIATMRVLTMQLNSITVMDIVAYGGAALGMILTARSYLSGAVNLNIAVFTILISADFFLPMRQLGSYFHIAMNGMAASDKIFKIIDIDTDSARTLEFPKNAGISIKDLSFSHDPSRKILDNIKITVPHAAFVSIVGESGCGKTTVASLLTLKNQGYSGNIEIEGSDGASRGKKLELSDISEKSILREITYIGHGSYLFKGTVRENLLIAKPEASDTLLWETLERVNLADFLKEKNGLDTALSERAANLSGGQRQRLALARALLHDSQIYIFDEATSNIDVESENTIMNEILALKGKKTVVLISHRLANVVESDEIYVLENGKVAESGEHQSLLRRGGKYAKLWDLQQKLENYEIGEALQ